MTDGNVTAIIGAFAPLLIALAALIRAYAASIEAKVNSNRLDRVEQATDAAHVRVDNLETGNIVDAIKEGRRDGK